MSHAALDWTEAETRVGEDGGIDVLVPWSPAPDWRVNAAFSDTLRIWQSESRGQRWQGINSSLEYVRIDGLVAGAEDALKTYLADALALAVPAAAANAAAEEAAKAPEQEARVAAAHQAQEAQRRLRGE